MTPRLAPLVAAAILVSLSPRAQAAEVAILKSSDVPSWRTAIDALKRVAATHAFTEYDLHGARGEADRVLEGLKSNEKDTILVSMGPLAAEAAREAFPQGPLVFCMVADPAKLGLLGAAGVVGVAFAIPLLNQLAAFRLVNPAGVRIGIVYAGSSSAAFLQAAKAADTVGVGLVGKEVPSEKEVPGALRSLLAGSGSVDALWFGPDEGAFGDATRSLILAEALKAGRPVYASSDALVSEGVLVSDGPSYESIGEEVGDLVNRIAAGEKGRIDMLMPRAELVVNKRMAHKLKIEIPQDALRSASRVY